MEFRKNKPLIIRHDCTCNTNDRKRFHYFQNPSGDGWVCTICGGINLNWYGAVVEHKTVGGKV